MNTDEALKCLRIAQRYRDSKDYANARKFTQKSINLHSTPEAEKLLRIIEQESSSEGSSSTSSSDSAKATGTETHATSSSARFRSTASSSTSTNGDASASSSKATYTEAQIKLVRRVRNCKVTDFYEILELQKTCDENDVKKAYKKLALQLHPDKNQAPGADEAFKMVSKAFQILSDSQKRAIYDQSGGDPDSRFGGGGGGEHDMGRHFNFNGQGMGGGFEGEISPEDLFNMFFGGQMGGVRGMGGGGFGPFGGPVFTASFGPGGFRRTYVQTGGIPRQRRAGEDGAGNGGGAPQSRWSMILQLAPLIFFFVFSILSNLSSLFSTPPPPHPSYTFTPQEPYTAPRMTSILSIPYYVSQAEFTKHPIWVSIPESARDKIQAGAVSRDLLAFERTVEQTWRNQMIRLCEREVSERERKVEANSGFLGIGADWDAVKRIRSEKLESCEELKSKRLIDRY